MMKIEYIRDNEEIEKIIVDLQKDNINLKEALRDGVSIMSKLYLYSPIEKLIIPRDIGLEGDYGGRVFRVAKIKKRNLYFLVDHLHTVIGFMREKEEIVEEEKEEDVDLKCEICGFEAKSKTGAMAHARKHK